MFEKLKTAFLTFLHEELLNRLILYLLGLLCCVLVWNSLLKVFCLSFTLIVGGSDKVLPGQTWPLDQPLAHMALPFIRHAAQVPVAG